MGIIVGSARIDENGKISGGSAGDQTGKEVSTQSFYIHSKGWYCYRPKSVSHANGIANAMQEACDNNNVGYDQYNRAAVSMVKKYGSFAKIAELTETDCSDTVRAAILQATGKDVGAFSTATEGEALEKSGLFETRFSVTSSSQVYDGDVLATKTKGHTVVVVSGRPRTGSSTSSSVSTSINKTTGKYCTDYTVKIATKHDPLNCRVEPVDGTVIGSLAKGTTTTITRLSSDGTWGLCSKGWIKLSYTTKVSSSSSSSSSASYTVGKTYTTLVDNLNVRTGAGTNYHAKAKKQLSVDGQKHANSKGQYKKGTRVTCKAVKKDSLGNVWISTPSGWLAAYYSGKKYIG